MFATTHCRRLRLAAATAASAVIASKSLSASTALAEGDHTTAPKPALMRSTESVCLSDGRLLAFKRSGDPHGVPVIALHGMGSSHCTWQTEQPLAELVPGVLLIAVDRPGYGDSTAPPAGYSYTQSARDLAQLADVLGLERFCVAGHSSGGPYALAAAALLPERVLACAAISSDAPYCHPSAPDAVRASDDMARGFYGKEPLSKVGKWRASDLAKGRADKAHAWKQGALGFVVDFSLERLPWSFRIEDVTLGERMHFWYGSEDYDAMRLGTPWMASLVDGARVIKVEGGNHGFKSEPVHLSNILSALRDAALFAPPAPPPAPTGQADARATEVSSSAAAAA